MNTFAIHEDNFERLEKKMTRIANKCKKYGCGFHFAVVGEEFRHLEEDENEIVKYIIVEAEGTAVVNGWQFIATIEHHENGNIIRNIKDINVPKKYYTCGPECEHCNSKRHRKETYLVWNEDTNEFKQVGSSCLCDFTQGLDAEVAASYIAAYDELIQGDSIQPGIRHTIYMDIKDVLKYAAKYVQLEGFVPSSYGEESTRSRVAAAWNYDNRRSSMWKLEVEYVEKFRAAHPMDYDSEENLKYVEDAMEYIRNLEEDSDYIHNLKVLVADKYITFRNLGYAVSIISVYNKHLDKLEYQKKRDEENAREAVSEYQGAVGDKIEIASPTVTAVTSWETMYGTTIRYKIIDQAGNVYMWDSSTYIDLDKEVALIKGTIKKHDEFNGIKQTWLTRCRTTYNEKRKTNPKSNTNSEKGHFMEEFDKIYDMWEA